MKKSLVLAAVLLAVLPVAAQNSFPASDSRITYVGRTLAEGSDVSFDWSATYARVSFEGNFLAVKASDSHKDYYNVWIDKDMCAEADKVIAIDSKEEKLIVLADAQDFPKKGPKTHTVIIQKRTEGEQGKTTFHEFQAKGNLLQAEPLKERYIEFVGDSYTCGYGSENSTFRNRYTPETQNTSKTYAAILARYFGADYVTISHSGQGICRNYDDGGKGLHQPDRYPMTFDMDRNVKWAGGPKPAMTMIYLGTNDFSTGRQPTRSEWKRNYMRLLNDIKRYYGEDHPILCVSSKADPMMFDYVREVVEDCGMKNVYYDGFYEKIHLDTEAELGADWHPNYQAHIKLAYALVPYISTITGWEIEAKPLQ